MINHVDKLYKQTPLHYAAVKGHVDMCRALVERGCNIMHTDSKKKTAADYARTNKFPEANEYLASEVKKLKEINKSQNLSQAESSHQNEANSKKKKREVTPPHYSKNSYKLS